MKRRAFLGWLTAPVVAPLLIRAAPVTLDPQDAVFSSTSIGEMVKVVLYKDKGIIGSTELPVQMKIDENGRAEWVTDAPWAVFHHVTERPTGWGIRFQSGLTIYCHDIEHCVPPDGGDITLIFNGPVLRIN